MCGIAGVFSGELATQSRVDSLKRMLGSLRHRGPDEMGYYFDGYVAMGTARLSIVDVKGGQQPISDASRRYWICFNGEIYNYKELKVDLAKQGCQFSTHSDTEVLLNAWIVWGVAALQKLNGAFAFCIYDRLRHSLILARDRFGKRPLYYTKERNSILFGSEMKSFLAHENFKFEFDSEQLASIFRVWTPIEAQSGFRGINQVPAGAYLYADQTSMKVENYTSLCLLRGHSDLEEPEAARLVYDTLAESVRLRLSGDVDVGVYLSGGIDSAIVAQLVATSKTAITKSFSIRFVDEEFDESSDQALLVDYLGTDHASVTIDSREIADLFPAALWHAEVPVFRTAFVPMFLLSKLANSRGIKVVLTGEGADEAFLGYDIFKETILRATWNEIDESAKQQQIARLYPYLRHFNETNHAALYAFFDRFSKAGNSEFFSHDVRFHNSTLSGRMLSRKYSDLQALSNSARAAHEQYATLSPIQKAQWLEFKTLLAGYLLSTQGDRMSLAHSVENRCPFLDPNVVGLGAATNLRFNDGSDEKYLLKKAFAGKLPDKILRKHKQPYRAPDASALIRAQPEYLEAVRSEHELKKIGDLDSKFCAAFVEKILSKPIDRISQSENQTFIFLLSVSLLHKQFVSRDFSPFADIEPLLVKQIDGRCLP
jgi:asparagine synthase (glutamine-hydrolysing)